MRFHLRRGHERSQHYGRGNALVKQFWIEPCFISADDELVSARTAYSLSV
jgi:hypothetical protein